MSSNIIECKLNEMIPYVLNNIKTQIRHPNKATSKMWISGGPGIGKSEIIKEICQKHGFGFVVKYLGTMALEQITGMPSKKKDDDPSPYTKWDTPEIFNFEEMDYTPDNMVDGETPIVLLLDDAHLCNKMVQNYMFQLLTYRGIHGHKLPRNVAILLAGNRSDDRAGFCQILAPVSNRIDFLDVKGDVEDWVTNYAIKNDVRYDIISYLRNNDTSFYTTPMESCAWASPRSWVYLSQSLTTFEETHGRVSDLDLIRLAAGHVGQEVAGGYVEFVKLVMKYDGEKILNGEEEFNVPEEKIEAYALLSAVSGVYMRYMKKDNYDIARVNQQHMKSMVKVLKNIGNKHSQIVPITLIHIINHEFDLTNSYGVFSLLAIDIMDNKSLRKIVEDLLMYKTKQAEQEKF